jgi:hypothetical protein
VSEDGDEKGFLTAKQLAACGRFDGVPSSEELERFFFLDDEDRKLIAKRRGAASRLGFALALTTVRFLGTFLDDPTVPSAVLDELAGQLMIADPSCVKTYVERANTRWEHRREICRVDGWREFASVREELSRWIDNRAWTTGSGPKAIFDGVIVWLRRRQVLLPAVKELERLVSRVAREAHARLWSTLADLLTAQQARLLLDLLETVHLTRARPAVPGRVQRHLPALPTWPPPTRRQRIPTRNDRPIHHLERGHRHGHSGLTQATADRPARSNHARTARQLQQVDGASTPAWTRPAESSRPHNRHRCAGRDR